MSPNKRRRIQTRVFRLYPLDNKNYPHRHSLISPFTHLFNRLSSFLCNFDLSLSPLTVHSSSPPIFSLLSPFILPIELIGPGWVVNMQICVNPMVCHILGAQMMKSTSHTTLAPPPEQYNTTKM